MRAPAAAFRDLLNRTLETGKRTGRIRQPQLDKLLNAEDFDETEFELVGSNMSSPPPVSLPHGETQ